MSTAAVAQTVFNVLGSTRCGKTITALIGVAEGVFCCVYRTTRDSCIWLMQFVSETAVACCSRPDRKVLSWVWLSALKAVC